MPGLRRHQRNASTQAALPVVHLIPHRSSPASFPQHAFVDLPARVAKAMIAPFRYSRHETKQSHFIHPLRSASHVSPLLITRIGIGVVNAKIDVTIRQRKPPDARRSVVWLQRLISPHKRSHGPGLPAAHSQNFPLNYRNFLRTPCSLVRIEHE